MATGTIHGLLSEIAAASPDRVLARFLSGGSTSGPGANPGIGPGGQGDRSVTARALLEQAQRCAVALGEAGLGPGDRVALLVENRPEFLSLWFGCALAGVVSVPLNTALRGDILTYMLGQTEPRLVVVEGAALQELRRALPEGLDPLLVTVGDGTTSAIAYEAFVGSARPEDHREPAIPATGADLLSIMYTSGTTGPSKGVMYSHRMGIALAESSRAVLGHGPDDIAFTCLPIFHANALYTSFMASLLGGGSTVVAPRFSASEFWTQVAASGATVVNLLGSMSPILWRQAPSPAERAHHLRIGLVIPSPVDHYEEFEERFGFAVTELYGLTDFGIPLGIPLGERRPGSCGRPLPGWRCEVVDPQDRIVPNGEVGELVVRPESPYIGALGYWRMPEATVTSRRNLWFHTGDLVRRDEEGWFFFVDRSKDAIRRFGENISSFEVEQVLLSHADVVDVAVYAVPAELAEDEVMAAIVLRPEARITPESLVEFCDPRLPYFAIPRYLEFVEALPRTETEKVQKSELRRRGVTEAAWDGGPRGRKARAARNG